MNYRMFSPSRVRMDGLDHWRSCNKNKICKYADNWPTGNNDDAIQVPSDVKGKKRRNYSELTKVVIKFNVASCTQRPFGLLGAGSPRRAPRLWHSSWALRKSSEWCQTMSYSICSHFVPGVAGSLRPKNVSKPRSIVHLCEKIVGTQLRNLDAFFGARTLSWWDRFWQITAMFRFCVVLHPQWP